jgi:hypothetical protein
MTSPPLLRGTELISTSTRLPSVLRSRRGVGDLDGAEDLLREELAREARLLVGDHGGVVAAANVT